jgi:23S rRNA G2069 N7-methylase RlmK/C1962 C5-methylase RlmI
MVVEFIETGTANSFRIGVQFPPATRIESSNEIVKKIEKTLAGYPNVKRISSKVEKLHTFVEVETRDNPEKVKKEFRKKLNIPSDAQRIFFGESDGIPAFIVDKFADVISFQTLCAGIDQYKDASWYEFNQAILLDTTSYPEGNYSAVAFWSDQHQAGISHFF